MSDTFWATIHATVPHTKVICAEILNPYLILHTTLMPATAIHRHTWEQSHLMGDTFTAATPACSAADVPTAARLVHMVRAQTDWTENGRRPRPVEAGEYF